MEKFTGFDLPLKGMPDGTQTFEYILGTEFFRNMESADVSAGNVKVALTVMHSGDIYELSFKLKGEINIPCDRCLDDMLHIVDTSYDMSVRYGEEYNEIDDDNIVIPESDNVFNVANVIYDTVMLTIPIKHVHPEGECNEEMREILESHLAHLAEDEEEPDEASDDRLDEEDAQDEEQCDPRWEILKKLKGNN